MGHGHRAIGHVTIGCVEKIDPGACLDQWGMGHRAIGPVTIGCVEKIDPGASLDSWGRHVAIGCVEKIDPGASLAGPPLRYAPRHARPESSDQPHPANLTL